MIMVSQSSAGLRFILWRMNENNNYYLATTLIVTEIGSIGIVFATLALNYINRYSCSKSCSLKKTCRGHEWTLGILFSGRSAPGDESYKSLQYLF